MKKGWIVGIILLIIIGFVIYYRRNSDKKTIQKRIRQDGSEKIITYRLPTSTDPEYFGPFYWKAIHNLVSEVPCYSCRKDGESLFVFAHDLVNYKLGKKIFDQKNFDLWLEKIYKIRDERLNKAKD